MKRTLFTLISIVIFLVGFIVHFYTKGHEEVLSKTTKNSYWLLLHRKSNIEELFLGNPGKPDQSSLIKTFTVKTGIPSMRPTPLPKLLGREYWIIVDKFEDSENPETSPYFLTLNIPVPTGEPFGPSPYTECGGQQCNWVREGLFGLHGIGGDGSKIAPEDPGSSGCIRHNDEDITYLYNLLDPKKEEIRYYVQES